MISTKPLLKKGFTKFGLVMVVSTITLAGFVAFRFLDAQDNTQVAVSESSTTQQVATVESAKDVEKVSEQLDTAELDNIDADLDAEFNF